MNTAARTVGLWLTVSVTYAQSGGGACRSGRYEVGLAVGRNQYFGDLHCSKPYPSSGINWSVQALLRRSLNRYVSLRTSLTAGTLTASDLDNPTHRWDYRRAQFTSSLLELAALVELYPLGQFSRSAPVKRPRLMPYGFVGFAGVYTNPTVSILPGASSPPSEARLAADQSSLTRTALAVPVGVGLRVAVAPAVSVHAEVGYRFTTSDYLDGFHEASYGRSEHNDSYLIASVGASYRLVGTDRDGDGTPDRCDACPRLYGLAQLGGCPDADNDGVIDPDDSCPDSFGDPATMAYQTTATAAPPNRANAPTTAAPKRISLKIPMSGRQSDCGTARSARPTSPTQAGADVRTGPA